MNHPNRPDNNMPNLYRFMVHVSDARLIWLKHNILIGFRIFDYKFECDFMTSQVILLEEIKELDRNSLGLLYHLMLFSFLKYDHMTRKRK